MVLNGEALERATTARVGRGLYLLRYASAPVDGRSLSATVRPSAGYEQSIELVSAPGVAFGALSRPGDTLVVRAERPGELTIKLLRQSLDSPFDASFTLELLSAGNAAAPTEASSASDAPADAFVDFEPDLRIAAHVARRGDVTVAAGQWVAGPAAPAAIEGLQIVGRLPAGVEVETQALIGARPPRWLDWTASGVFAGTRGRAIPLVGLRLRLVGPAAARFALRVEALFLGAAIVSKTGREVELVGAGASDPLVGLRLDISAVESIFVEREARSSVVAARQLNGEQRNEPRVRVFRAQPGI